MVTTILLYPSGAPPQRTDPNLSAKYPTVIVSIIVSVGGFADTDRPGFGEGCPPVNIVNKVQYMQCGHPSANNTIIGSVTIDDDGDEGRSHRSAPSLEGELITAKFANF